MVQQTLSPVCRRINNYFVVLLYTNVSSFLLQELGSEVFCYFAGGFTEKLLLFCQVVRYGIMNQFAGSFHADLF
jgi:hypothetical protein